MKKLLFGAVIALMVTSCVSCIPSSVIHGSGREAHGEFDVMPNYTELSVSSGIVVELVDSPAGEGYITADERALDYVAIVQDGGRVKISYEPFISVHSDITTVVTIPASDALTRIDASSAAKVRAQRRLLGSSMEVDCSSAAVVDLDMDVRELSIDLSSAASFSGNVVVQNLEVEVNSAARCDIRGSADHCDVETSSAAGFRGFDLVCRRASAEASSGGSIEISATEELDAEASSGGSVRYKGSPAVVRRHTSSGGSIHQNSN